jgi:hypothetical protein
MFIENESNPLKMLPLACCNLFGVPNAAGNLVTRSIWPVRYTIAEKGIKTNRAISGAKPVKFRCKSYICAPFSRKND